MNTTKTIIVNASNNKRKEVMRRGKRVHCIVHPPSSTEHLNTHRGPNNMDVPPQLMEDTAKSLVGIPIRINHENEQTGWPNECGAFVYESWNDPKNGLVAGVAVDMEDKWGSWIYDGMKKGLIDGLSLGAKFGVVEGTENNPTMNDVKSVSAIELSVLPQKGTLRPGCRAVFPDDPDSAKLAIAPHANISRYVLQEANNQPGFEDVPIFESRETIEKRLAPPAPTAPPVVQTISPSPQPIIIQLQLLPPPTPAVAPVEPVASVIPTPLASTPSPPHILSPVTPTTPTGTVGVTGEVGVVGEVKGATETVVPVADSVVTEAVEKSTTEMEEKKMDISTSIHEKEESAPEKNKPDITMSTTPVVPPTNTTTTPPVASAGTTKTVVPVVPTTTPPAGTVVPAAPVVPLDEQVKSELAKIPDAGSLAEKAAEMIESMEQDEKKEAAAAPPAPSGITADEVSKMIAAAQAETEKRVREEYEAKIKMETERVARDGLKRQWADYKKTVKSAKILAIGEGLIEPHLDTSPIEELTRTVELVVNANNKRANSSTPNFVKSSEGPRLLPTGDSAAKAPVIPPQQVELGGIAPTSPIGSFYSTEQIIPRTEARTLAGDSLPSYGEPTWNAVTRTPHPRPLNYPYAAGNDPCYPDRREQGQKILNRQVSMNPLSTSSLVYEVQKRKAFAEPWTDNNYLQRPNQHYDEYHDLIDKEMRPEELPVQFHPSRLAPTYDKFGLYAY